MPNTTEIDLLALDRAYENPARVRHNKAVNTKLSAVHAMPTMEANMFFASIISASHLLIPRSLLFSLAFISEGANPLKVSH